MTQGGERVLVTGATGFLGEAVVRALATQGRSVRAAVRHDPGNWHPGVEVVRVGELGPDTDWSLALRDVEVIVHCAARAHVLRETADDPLAAFRRANTEGAAALARQAKAAGVQRLVFISSIGVNGSETTGKPFTAHDAPRPQSPYAVSKYEAELALAEIAADGMMELVVIRPPLVTGPDAKGNLGTLARWIDRGIPLPLGLVTGNRRDLVSRETLVDLIGVCLDHPAARGQTFLISDGRPVSTRQLLVDMAARQGRRAKLWPMPPLLLDLGLRALGRTAMRSQLLGDLELDIAHTRRTLNWHPTSLPHTGAMG
ncbi:MAG: NAD-dependent epimerase/dehydratase family protein [Brevundimonas sp.]|uniref:NAD-dependent epimerase/dehydratase family protein n=1 Tax=Brevundimonas sp. TaxID=1871086 RepID=UPI001A318D00|nr:NAD-dependent epimerase/dehydratase family protein [Brevundimonas sp.]MBJ7446905.1 NAD-dependent epimerase/dehydratase family protein [Brevundimonas sp.]